MATARNKRAGTGVRQIAREWQSSPAYVSQFLKKAGLQPLPGGGYDLTLATRLRERCTLVGTGKARYDRHHLADEVHTCQQCGALYTPAGARREGNVVRDIERYCEELCQADAESGVSPADTLKKLRARHLFVGGSRADFKNPDRWLNYWSHYRKGKPTDFPRNA